MAIVPPPTVHTKSHQLHFNSYWNLYALHNLPPPSPANVQLLAGFDGRGLWLNALLLDVSSPSLCGIFRSGLSGSQMNTLSAGTVHLTARERPLLKMPHRDAGETSRRREFSHQTRITELSLNTNINIIQLKALI